MAKKPRTISLKDAAIARDAITRLQKAQISLLYEEWAHELRVIALRNRSRTYSANIEALLLNDLADKLQAASNRVTLELTGIVERNIYIISSAVMHNYSQLMSTLGFNPGRVTMAFSHVPEGIVEKLATGQIYEQGFSLSKKIWGHSDAVLQELYSIVAKGVATNSSIYDIAKALEAYVDPKVRKQWNFMGPDKVKIFKKQVDYNAQRLARTLVQHAYQQSIVEVTLNNPFITSYMWISNGSRACEKCIEMDGNIYEKDQLPLDHPNGMCIIEMVVKPTMNQDLRAWLNGKHGDYPDIDNFAKELGYNPLVFSDKKDMWSF